MSKLISRKKIRKAIRKNPYTAGVTAAVLAVGAVAAAASRNPRMRELKDSLVRRLKPAVAPERTEVATASEPY